MNLKRILLASVAMVILSSGTTAQGNAENVRVSAEITRLSAPTAVKVLTERLGQTPEAEALRQAKAAAMEISKTRVATKQQQGYFNDAAMSENSIDVFTVQVEGIEANLAMDKAKIAFEERRVDLLSQYRRKISQIRRQRTPRERDAAVRWQMVRARYNGTAILSIPGYTPYQGDSGANFQQNVAKIESAINAVRAERARLERANPSFTGPEDKIAYVDSLIQASLSKMFLAKRDLVLNEELARLINSRIEQARHGKNAQAKGTANSVDDWSNTPTGHLFKSVIDG